jgi:hypothetical protein
MTEEILSIRCSKCDGACMIKAYDDSVITCTRCNGMGRLFGKAAEDSMLITMAASKLTIPVYFGDHFEDCLLINFHAPSGDAVVRRGTFKVTVKKSQLKGVKYP